MKVKMVSDVQQYELGPSPSSRAGVPAALEDAVRVWACEFIQHVGVVLRRPQTVMACAQILLQRFYYRQSLLQYHVEVRGPPQ